jgi:Mitochondrial ATPase expression
MNGAIPLLRIVDCSVKQSFSHIPHIRAHILSRRLRTSSSTQRSYLPTAGSRQLSKPFESRQFSSHDANANILSFDDGTTRLPWFGTQKPETNEHEHRVTNLKEQEGAEGVQKLQTANEEVIVPDVQLLFENLLDHGHPDRVMFALDDPEHGTSFIKTANDAAFTRAFCKIDPAHFIELYVPLYRNLDPHLHLNMKYRRCRSLEARWNSFLAFLNKVISLRKEAGHNLTLDVHRHLLKCAGAMGDETFARDVFETLIPDEGLEPDLQCYNYYLKAVVWSGWYDVRYRNRTRVIQSNLDFRRHSTNITRKTKFAEKGFKPRRPPPSAPEMIRRDALATFQNLTKQGFSGDEETFTSLMLALSQAGDLAGVKSILKSVWNVDVDLLVQFDEEEIESPTYYEEDSPLRPTENLLSTVLHVFVSHNDVSLAYTVLDYISRNYNLKVPADVWMWLYEMTFVLCCRRGWGPGSDRYAARGEYNAGQLDKGALRKLFDLITDEPHNMEPSVTMWIMLARIEREQRMLDLCLDYVRRAIVIFDEEKTRLSALYDEMQRLVLQGPFDSDFLTKRREFIFESIRMEKSL